LNGLLERLDLPLGGSYEWDWQAVLFPKLSGERFGAPVGIAQDPPHSRSVGVSERRHLNRSGGVLGRWSYEHALTNFGDGDPRELVVTETAEPPGHVTKHYFSVWPGDPSPPFDPHPEGWSEHEYGLPFTRTVDDGATDPRFLSRRIYDEDGVLKRTVYVRYERSGDTRANPRLVSQRTVYHDDAGRRADLDLSNFDGLGHFRQEQATGNFPGTASRTTTTSWNPGRSLSNLPGPSDPWVLDTYDSRQVSEGGQTIVQDFDFNEANGFLKRTRTRASTAGACGATDIVVERTHLSGFPRLENVYGGDGQALAVNCTDLAGLSLPADPVYRRRHTHTCGVLSKTEILQPGGGPLSFLPLDLTIDCDSGLVASARDTAELQTSFSYDLLGRLTLEDLSADQGADTTYQYDREGTSGNLPARVKVQRKDGSAILAEAHVRIDGLGRVEEERRTMPDGTLAVRQTLWSSRGWIENRSEWEADADPERSNTEFRQYDPFGRPRRINLPDGQMVTISYAGDGSRTITVPVATGLTAAGEPILTNASTTEVYDRFGRLVTLFEPNDTKTSYLYDAQGNLVQVSGNDGGSPVQTRTFSYDGRGFLTSESHPELGTSILYSDFDPQGNPGRIRRGGWDLAYSYDAAGRLTEIKERGTTRVWKSWDYATGNSQAGQWSKGKLRSASRHNRVTNPATGGAIEPIVTESYEYSGVGGRISKVTTEVAVGGSPRFEYALGYDPLGNVTSRTYPRCTHSFCSQANVARTVTAAYTQGLLIVRLLGVSGPASRHRSQRG
jgi:YD repeat-containing protein